MSTQKVSEVFQYSTHICMQQDSVRDGEQKLIQVSCKTVCYISAAAKKDCSGLYQELLPKSADIFSEVEEGR